MTEYWDNRPRWVGGVPDPAVVALGESRARFGGQEARILELEAVIEKARALVSDPGGFFYRDVIEIINAYRPVVLADHDAAVWDDGFLRGLVAASRVNEGDTLADWEYPTGNPYRVSGQHESTTDFLNALDDLAGEA